LAIPSNIGNNLKNTLYKKLIFTFMKHPIKFSIAIFTTIPIYLVLNGCDKDDNIPGNPTNGKTTAVFNSVKSYGIMTDQDRNVYKTIRIGAQIWMAENLRTTKYRNGNSIPEISDNKEWKSNLSTGAYCNYENTQNNDTIATYGRLYNWYAVSDSQNIAPTGWHVATDSDWTILITCLGDGSDVGGKMKESGKTHWFDPNTDATNESGFTALPSGDRWGSIGTFENLGYYTIFWSSTPMDSSFAIVRGLSYGYDGCDYYGFPKYYGCSIRCVKN
jgi:uncharacterized protein (TIGR02145 family)